MKVILKEDVDNLGEMGDTVNVARGFARNFLVPRQLAVVAESASAKQIEHELAVIKRREEKVRAKTREFAKTMDGVTADFKVRAGEGDKIFGSVTAAMIAEKITELGFEINKKSVQLPEPIKSLGIYSVKVKFPGGIEANVKVWVSAIEEAKPVEEEVEEEETADQAEDED